MCCALPTLVLQQLEATRLASSRMKTTNAKKFRVTIILFQEPYEKVRRRKKRSLGHAVVSQWTGARSKVVWISGSSITSKKNTCPALPEEDGVIKIFKSTLWGFRCFRTNLRLKRGRESISSITSIKNQKMFITYMTISFWNKTKKCLSSKSGCFALKGCKNI